MKPILFFFTLALSLNCAGYIQDRPRTTASPQERSTFVSRNELGVEKAFVGGSLGDFYIPSPIEVTSVEAWSDDGLHAASVTLHAYSPQGDVLLGLDIDGTTLSGDQSIAVGAVGDVFSQVRTCSFADDGTGDAPAIGGTIRSTLSGEATMVTVDVTMPNQLPATATFAFLSSPRSSH